MRAFTYPLPCWALTAHCCADEYLSDTNCDVEGLALLRSLPPSMYAEIATCMYAQMVRKVPLFKEGEVPALHLRGGP